MSQHARSPTSSTLIVVSPFPIVNHPSNGHSGVVPIKKKPDLKLGLSSHSPGFFPPDIDKQMRSGKGFIEPHRNNLPRRKRRVVTAPPETGVSHSLLPTSEAGPRSSPEDLYATTTPGPTTGSYASSSSSSSLDTNITEPPSSLRATPSPSPPLQKPPALSKPPPSTTKPIFQTPKRTLFQGHHLDDASLVRSPPPITPTKGHLQPTSATLPRRRRSLVLSVARAEERRRRQQQTTLDTVQSQVRNDAWIRQTRPEVDTDPVTDLESQKMQRIQSMCSQELTKGLVLGFFAEGDEHDENIVRINVYTDSTTPVSSLIPTSSSSSGSPLPSPASSSPSNLHLQLSLPSNPLSYTDGTTSLTDSQIQQACTFIDEHISIILESSNNNTRRGRASVLILAPRTRPEEAMSIGVCYLAGIEELDKGGETEGHEGSGNNDDGDDNHHTYSTIHRLMMAFHDDPGSPIPNHSTKLEVKESHLDTSESSNPGTLAGCGIDTDGWRGLRSEWRGVLSFDGMQRLDRVWTSTRRG
ncbi:hypothetical protein BYT27DRAFT_7248676 [Phlegmacium glaucopus]|nr:hypothetical protein BYT27DRAFT_7248676 [Phlegmacium glaucopus]